MSISDTYKASNGLLVESDFVSLSTSLELNGNFLNDVVVNANHRLHPLAARAISFITNGGIPAKKWIEKMQSTGMTIEEIRQISAFINTIAGFQVNRDLKGWLTISLARLNGLVYGFGWISFAERHKPSLSSIGKTTAKALLPLIALIPLSGVLLYGIGFPVKQTIVISSVFLGLLWFSAIWHEYTHFLFTKNTYHCNLVVRRLRIGLLHEPMKREEEIMSAVLGPLAGAATSILGALILQAFFQGLPFIFTGYIVAAFHLISWLPFYGDGETLLAQLAGKKL